MASSFMSLFAPPPSPTKKQKKMSLTQTYFLAHAARAKLSREAARADHDLRLLVGHANMLDALMLELSEAEKEQERWFNQSVRGATSTSTSNSTSTPKHIQWVDTLVQEPERDWDAQDVSSSDTDSDSEDDSDYEQDEDFFVGVASSTPVALTPSKPSSYLSSAAASTSSSQHLFSGLDYEEVEDIEDLDQEENDDLTLTRTNSRQQPPELLDDSEDESEEELLPLSPPQPSYDHFSASPEHEEALVSSTTLYTSSPNPKPQPDQSGAIPNVTVPLSKSDQSSFIEEGFYLPPRDPRRVMIETY
ncbi:hypothetical protein FQN57_007079 [Myotisia sp. PD_48]|nr:hypothetical protein FQN57_007079 [Myotisia sp. PD_48]